MSPHGPPNTRPNWFELEISDGCSDHSDDVVMDSNLTI